MKIIYKNFKCALHILPALLFLLLGTGVFAQTSVWTGDVDTDWSNSANWSGGVPTTGYTAIVPGAPQGGAFPVYEGGYLIDYTIQNGGTLTFNTVIYNIGVIINFDGGMVNSNELFINAGSITFDNDGEFKSYSSLENYGIIDNAASGALEIVSGSFNNYGSVTNFGNVSNLSGTSINNYGVIESVATLTINGSFDNYGTLNSAVGSTLILNGSGYLTNHNNAYFECTCDLSNSSTITNNGKMQVNFSSNFDNDNTLLNNGTLGLSGNLVNDGTFENNSTINILDAGVLTNNTSFSNNGSIDLTICGTIVQNATGNIGGTILSDGLIYEINGTVNDTNLEFSETFTDISQKKKPIAGCKPNVFVQLPESGSIAIPTTTIDKGSYGSCGAQLTSVTVTPSSFTLADIGQQVVTLDIEDEFGFTSSCDAVITVLEFQEPIAATDNPNIEATCAQDISIIALPGAVSASATWTEPTATTTCSTGGDADCTNAPDVDGMMYLGSFEGSHYYKKTSGDITYAEAKSFVESRGGTLPVITSQAENDFVTSTLDGGSAWIGLTDENVEGTFEWATGEALSYMNWNVNEPNDYNANEDYVHILSSGKWNDHTASIAYWAIMEIACQSSTEPDCSLVSNDIADFIYMGEHNNSKYYCSSSNNFTWHNAKAAAESFGGHLAIVDDAAENEFIRNAILADYVWLGLTDEVVEGDFKTVFGDNAPYLNWSSGEPNNSGGTEHFARLIKSSGQWTDRDAAFLAEYVMEIPCPSSPVAGPQTCSLENHGPSSNGIDDRLLWMNYDHLSQNKEYGVINTSTFTEFPDGTALLTGTVNRVGSSNKEWTYTVNLINKRTWSEWSALGRSFKPNNSTPSDHTQWSYYEIDNSSSIFIGSSAFDGKALNITHAPTDYTYGFQIGVGANLYDGDYGISGWFNFTGSFSGKGDFNGDLNNCTENTTTTSDIVTIEQIQGQPAGADFPIGTTVIAYKFTDDCGNEEICTFDVTIEAIPTTLEVTCVENIVIDALPGAGSSIVSWTEPTATTDCYINEAFVNRTDEGPANGDAFPTGTTFVSYAAIDSCFNFEGCVFQVTVNEIPALLELTNCPGDINSFEEVVDWALPIATSNCYEAGVNVTQIAGPAPGSTFPEGTTEILYLISDACGNTQPCSFNVNVDLCILDQIVSVAKSDFICDDGGAITFSFPDTPDRTQIAFSLDGGNSYESNVSDAIGSKTYDGLSAGTYDLSVRWGNSECPASLGSVTISDGGGLPIAEVTTVNTTCENNSGSITFSFPNNPNRTQIEFSLDGGNTWVLNISDAIGSHTIDGISIGTYDLFARWGNSQCVTPLGETTISSTNAGGSCNDNDDCTTGDVYDANCNCAGTFADADNDGVCDANDICEGSDDTADADGDGTPDGCDDCDTALAGTSCDDGDACTTGDVYDANCNCAGTFADADADGVCAAEDCDDNDASLPAIPGSSCDDGDAATTNDIILADGCGCAGEVVPTGGCDDIIIAEAAGVITTSGYSDPIVFVKIYNSNWSQIVFDSGMLSNNEPQTITGLGEGTYHVYVKTYDAAWTQLCDESMTVTISGAPGLPGISINNVTVNEEDGIATLEICLTNTSDEDVTVDYSTQEVLALEGSDYTAISGTATILAGELCTSVEVEILDDEFSEETETFSVDIGNATGAVITNAKGVVTIIDTDGAPTGGCADITITENGGVITTSGYNYPIVFVKVYDMSWNTIFDSGMITDNSDQVISGLSEGSYNVYVKTYDSSWTELCDEAALITVSGAPSLPGIFINDVTVQENAGTATLQICIDQISSEDVLVDYATSNGTAILNQDYATLSGSAIILAGETCVDVVVSIDNTSDIEPTEEFYIDLTSPQNGIILDDQGVVTILDDDATDPEPSIYVTDITVDEEAGSALVDVCITFASDEAVTVDYATTDGSAFSGDDYGTVSGTATIAAGELCTQILVPIADDSEAEATEVLYIDLSSAANGTIGDDQGVITILDTDQPSTGGCDDITITEDGGVISTSGYDYPIVFVKVYDMTWSLVFDSGMLSNNEPQTITGLPEGTYNVYVKTYNMSWTQQCDETLQITITEPTVDPCIDLGGDSDGDGVCDDNDICAGFDDSIDSDGDGIPDGCDDATTCVEREATNVISCTGTNEGLPYGGWLKIEGMNSRYDLVNSQLVENEEGTATLTGSWVNQAVPECIFDFVIELSGRTTEPGADGTKLHNCLDPNYDDFYYYSDFTGTLTGSNEMAGAAISIESFGASFQIGVGANATGADLVFGASGWFSGDLLSQPDNGWNLVLNPNADGHLGDININLSGGYEACLDVPMPTGDNSPCGTVVTTGDGSISIGGYSEPVAIVQIFNSQWQLMYSCMGDCANPLTVDNLPAGDYLVKVNLYDANWSLACTEYAEYHTVSTGQGLEGQAAAEFLFFNAAKDDRQVAVNWTTNTEFKNDYFVVERSIDGLNFEALYDVSSLKDEGNAATYYQDNDERPNLGINYYRLKQVYADGSHRYSQVKTVTFDVDLFDFTIYPNPTVDMVFVNLKEYEGKSATIQLMNSIGEVITDLRIDSLTAEPIGFNVENHAAGIYGVTIQIDGHKRLTRLFVKSKL